MLRPGQLLYTAAARATCAINNVAGSRQGGSEAGENSVFEVDLTYGTEIAGYIQLFFVVNVSFTLYQAERSQSNDRANQSDDMLSQVYGCTTNPIPIRPCQGKGNPQTSKERSGSLRAGQVCWL